MLGCTADGFRKFLNDAETFGGAADGHFPPLVYNTFEFIIHLCESLLSNLLGNVDMVSATVENVSFR